MANAFNSIAPQFAACPSSSKRACYDVFINHRGPDVKHKLASSIYNMLDLMGVQAFLDQEELELGDSFPEAIEDAIHSASVHIAIFSPRYAESPWCLNELLLMLQTNVTIIPVFSGVQPSDLRHVENGIYADAFYRHRHKGRYDLEKIQKWKEALGSASNLNGRLVDGDNCDQGKLLREIVETVIHKIKKVPLEFATFPVGLDEAVQDFENNVGSSTRNGNVHIVGIVGMGGIGKTTLAKELYNRKRSSIYRSSFLSEVRDAASTNTLHNLQKNLLNDFHIQHSAFHNIHEGMGILARGLRSMTVLIVLDDVDDVEQMHALLPREDSLGRGSFIIVTTREVDVLTSWGISSIYPMKLLDPLHAKQLFCRHAFQHPYSQLGFKHPVEKYHNFQDLINRSVEACHRLPLSLKVLGAMVKGKPKAFWESQLSKISRILPNKIAERLQLSYDALDSEVREMFLDLACFFIGEKKSLVVSLWDGSGWSGEVGWETLVNKCLVGLDEADTINMHNHLRDLGRKIAGDISVSPSRIWKEMQTSTQDGRTPIRGIVAGKPLHSRTSTLAMDTYYPLPSELCMEYWRPSLRALQLLAVKGNDFREEFLASSRGLVWLRLWEFTGTNIPSWLSLKSLRILELYNAQNLEELWQDNVQLPSELRELIIDITGKTCFRGLPRSIGCLTHLRKIVLNGCASAMSSMPEEICNLQSLEFLQLSNFSVLSSLPDDFGKLTNLRSLNLWKMQLTALPDSFKQLTKLQSLYIDGCQSLTFTSEILEFPTQLQVLRILDCSQLEELPHLTTLVSLRELDLSYNTRLKELPSNIGQLTKLQDLVIGSYNMTSLPGSLGELSSLNSLKICSCEMLESLPGALGRLSNLRSLDILSTPLVELGLGIGSPSGCNLRSLKYLAIVVTKVCRISISHDCCPVLEELTLMYNDYLTEIETLPRNVRIIYVEGCQRMKKMTAIGGLMNLERLAVIDCPDLEVLPCPTFMHSVGHLLSIRGCPKAGIIDHNHYDDDSGYPKTGIMDMVFNKMLNT